jgi:hypothetical protein
MITSNTTYDTFGTANWVSTNANNDHYNPYRQDYQLDLPFYLNGTAGTINQGVFANVAREKTFRFPMRAFGRYMQVTITSTSGTVALRNISINDTESQRATKST